MPENHYTTSERQRAITLAQVQNKMHEAKGRCTQYMGLAVEHHNSEILYNEYLSLAIKAASDYETWRKVWEAIK